MPAITKTTVGLNLLRSARSGADTALIKFVALGTSNTAPTAGDTTLGHEVFRKAVSTYTNGATGEILVSMYLAPGDSIGTDIEEVAFFAGNTATSTPNSGVMIGRGLYTHNPKTALESITFQLDETFS